jgi:hypothetical protein
MSNTAKIMLDNMLSFSPGTLEYTPQYTLPHPTPIRIPDQGRVELTAQLTPDSMGNVAALFSTLARGPHTLILHVTIPRADLPGLLRRWADQLEQEEA